MPMVLFSLACSPHSRTHCVSSSSLTPPLHLLSAPLRVPPPTDCPGSIHNSCSLEELGFCISIMNLMYLLLCFNFVHFSRSLSLIPPFLFHRFVRACVHTHDLLNLLFFLVYVLGMLGVCTVGLAYWRPAQNAVLGISM